MKKYYEFLYENFEDDSEFEDDFNEDDNEDEVIKEKIPIRRQNYEMKKVFTIYNMDGDLREKFYDIVYIPGNDCYIRWWVELDEEDSDSVQISKWFIENGADDGEVVLVDITW